jgi:hypothetical protein
MEAFLSAVTTAVSIRADVIARALTILERRDHFRARHIGAIHEALQLGRPILCVEVLRVSGG